MVGFGLVCGCSQYSQEGNEETMNDGMYTNIRNYLEEIAGTQREILKELQSRNAAPQATQPSTTDKPAVPRHETTPPVEGLAGFAQPPAQTPKKK